MAYIANQRAVCANRSHTAILLSFNRLIAVLGLTKISSELAEKHHLGAHVVRPLNEDKREEARAYFIDGIARRLLPKKPCLTAAVAARLMLSTHRIDSVLVLGVAKGDNGQMIAHAWLKTMDNLVVAGREKDLDKYSPVGVFVSTNSVLTKRSGADKS